MVAVACLLASIKMCELLLKAKHSFKTFCAFTTKIRLNGEKETINFRLLSSFKKKKKIQKLAGRFQNNFTFLVHFRSWIVFICFVVFFVVVVL